MTVEPVGHNQSIGQLTGEPIPQSVAMRQSWQPIATQKSGALMAGIDRRTALMFGNILRISDWHEQFAHRIQPWSEWTAMPLEFLRDNVPPPETGSPGLSDSSYGAIAATFATAAGVQPHTTEISSVEAIIDPSTATSQRLTRPAINLSTLRVGRTNTLAQPHRRGSTMESQNSSSNLRVDQQTGADRLFSSSNLRVNQQTGADRLFSSAFPSSERPQMEPRLVPNIAPNPRREIKGGFPTRPLPLEALVQPEVQPEATDESGSSRRSTIVVAPLPVEMEILPSRTTTPDEVPTLTPQVVSPEPLIDQVIDQESAIAKLIANSFLPVPMPGLEIRMASPNPQGNSPQATQTLDNSSSSTSSVLPPPPPAPQLNINEIADKVYQTIQRRQQIERERRGLY